LTVQKDSPYKTGDKITTTITQLTK